MSIDAIINKVTPSGNDLVLDLMAREVGGVSGQVQLRIKNYTHVPIPGQEIWGSGICIIEAGQGVRERKLYRRQGVTNLFECEEA